MYLTHLSVRPVLDIVSSLKPHNIISENCVDNKDKLCSCAFWQKITIQFFFRSYVTFELKFWPNFVWIFRHNNDILSTIGVHVYRKLLLIFFYELCPLNLWFWPLYITAAVYNRNSSETTQQNFMKLYS